LGRAATDKRQLQLDLLLTQIGGTLPGNSGDGLEKMATN
jgi:hypothetical protein